MADTIPDIAITDLTSGALDGTGVFDKMMAATKLHLEQEFNKNRITGPNYSTVYLGALNTVMGQAMQFLLQKEAVSLQAQLLEQQIIIAKIEAQKAQVELEMLSIARLKANAEVDQLNAQTDLIKQQIINTVTENLSTIAKTDLIRQQIINTQAELLNTPKQGQLLDAQVCKLKADYDLTVNTNLRTTEEIELTRQKTITEKAQTLATGVDANSVVGKQKALYQAQIDGFSRDAEQKMAKILVDTWSARRMSDDGTVADGVNMLQDTSIGRAINKLLAGVGA